MSWIQNVYFFCAVVGGTVLVVQTILLVLAGGGDGDADVGPDDIHDGTIAHGGHGDAAHEGHMAEHAHLAFIKVLSFKSLVAFVTFFGLGGMASTQGGFGMFPSLLVAVGAGAGALYLVAYLMTALSRLQSRGNLDLRNAVGQSGTVYLTIPGARGGQGKVTVAVQGRRVECKAVTDGPGIPTGREVRVVALSTPDTLEVQPLAKE